MAPASCSACTAKTAANSSTVAQTRARVRLGRAGEKASAETVCSRSPAAWLIYDPDVGKLAAMLATLEGIVLDPVYSGKTLACLLLMLEAGDAAQYENIVFIHTGGSPALFAYQDDIEYAVL